jgi:hypothetical protein
MIFCLLLVQYRTYVYLYQAVGGVYVPGTEVTWCVGMYQLPTVPGDILCHYGTQKLLSQMSYTRRPISVPSTLREGRLKTSMTT